MEEESRPGRPEIIQLLVRIYRSLRGWGQMELALNSGVDASSICHYERGDTTPQRKTHEKLAAAVDLTLPFVETCLVPALAATRGASVPFDDETFRDLKTAGAELDRALAGTGRSAIGLLMRTLEEEDREPWERAGPPGEADRLEAAEAWERLADCDDAKQRRYLVETCPEFQTWAVAERLCHASEEAAPDAADDALELAKLAWRVVELARCEEPFRSRLRGYALAFLANARHLGKDLRGAKEDFNRALQLWQAGAAAPDLLAEWRLPALPNPGDRRSAST